MELKACPNKPNCISTQSRDSNGGLGPFLFSGDIRPWRERLIAIIQRMPGSKIVEDREDYLHVEFRSRIFRFVDDLEVCLDGQGKRIHFRSASRVGYYDFGVNRKRISSIQKEMKK